MPVKTFVQRTTLRDSIREQLLRELDDNRKGETKKVGVWGLGGAGKSQLVRSYLQHYRADYNATFWIQAGQPTSIDRDFLQVYNLLFKAEQNQLSTQDVLLAVHGWFMRRPGTWLFVFDGADQLEKDTDPQFVDLDRYIPGSPNVHVIITGRSSTTRILSTFEGVEVRNLEESQAVELFFKCAEITKTQPRVEDEMKKIVKELGYLALAISLAGRYVSQTPRISSNLPAYLEEFRQRRKQLLSEQPNKLIYQYGDSVMTAWETSYSAVESELPEASRLLTLLAFLNYEDIFPGLFGLDAPTTSAFSQQLWTFVIREDGDVKREMVEKCFATLEKYSLLQQHENEVVYSMHRLVHAWDHDRLLEERSQDMQRFCLAALQLLFNAIKTCTNTPQGKLRLVPHLGANFNIIKMLGTTFGSYHIEVSDQVEYIGGFISDIGRWQEAAAMMKEVLEKRQRILGDEHPDTITAMSNLATTLQDQGELEAAAAMMREVLEKMQRILGDEHPDTITAMSNLAITLQAQGELEAAAAMKREVLEKMQRILGDEHPATITAMSNLATTLQAQGKLEAAAAMMREVLEKRQRILGDEHPDTITAMSNLAITVQVQESLQASPRSVDYHINTQNSQPKPKKRQLFAKILDKLRHI
jgi:tetratricopeptide (TPR) repeat protein